LEAAFSAAKWLLSRNSRSLVNESLKICVELVCEAKCVSEREMRWIELVGYGVSWRLLCGGGGVVQVRDENRRLVVVGEAVFVGGARRGEH